ncbi:MAG: ABC transporter permease [Bacilli bacterium]|nr:ABC transporter permease [Bacilli bacterium]
MNYVVSFLSMAIKFATVFLFGATGEIINQKSGHLNMGTPGIMYLGAFGGILGERIYLDAIGPSGALNPFMIVFMPILFAVIFGAIGGAIFSFFTVTLHCNQNVTGLTLTTLGVGIACFFIGTMDTSRMPEVGMALQHAFTGYENLGWFGEIFLSQSWFTYLGVVVAIAAAIIIKYTRVGLHLRAVGEDASAADAAGVNVNRYRYIATLIGGAIAGIGGAFYELDNVKGMFNVADGIDAFGWLALCIVIFSMWKPQIAIGASFLFACMSIAPTFFAPYLGGARFATYLLKMLPYVATIVVLIIVSILDKKNQPPANLGVPYFREDR